MFKKGLVTLVCLTVMSALWSWATTSYSVQTNIAPLGTYNTGTKTADGRPIYAPVIGGSVKIRTLAVGDSIAAKDWATHTGGTKTATVLNTQTVEVDVDAADGYKIGSVYKTTYSIVNGIPVKNAPVLITPLDDPELHTETIVDQDPFGRTQILDVTFVPKSTDGGNPLNWQLQVQNNNIGGKVVVNRGVSGQATYLNETVSSIGKPWIKNFLDDGKVTLTVSAAPGYKIDYITKNGVKTFLAGNDVSEVVELAGTATSRVKTLNVGYKKISIQVTTHDGQTVTYPVLGGGTQTIAKDYGILPINPFADPYGVVRLIVTPTANQNKVNAINVVATNPVADGPFAGTVKYYDRFGTVIPVLGNHIGPVKVTISNITKPITVTADYGINLAAAPAVQNCTQTCHMDAVNVAQSVRAAATDWEDSKHAAVIDCVGCHVTMPGPQVTGAKCATCHTATATAKASSLHAVATGHTTGTCQRCHTGDGARHGAETGWTGGYTDVLSQVTYTPVPAGNGVGCNACHNSHNGELLSAKTMVAGALVDWNPNGNAVANDQYDVCTSCHTASDMYHENSSINVTRIIGDTHFDLATASTTIEGYVIRAKSANPCADCHDLHSADLAIQEAWAESAHAGKIATKKEAAACTEAVAWVKAQAAGTVTPAPGETTTCSDTVTIGTSSRTVLSFFQRSTAGVAFYKTTGALDDHDGNAWTHYDWDKSYKADGSDAGTDPDDDRAQCQRCHTATGISNYLNNPTAYDPVNNDFGHLAGWTGTPGTRKGDMVGSKQNELLYCWGCHSNSQTGALRNPGALTENYTAVKNATTGTDGSAVSVAHADYSKSNVCMGCHMGRQVGGNIANITDADGVLGFVNSHYLAAGLTISGKGGYEFAGQNYSNLGFHKNVGQTDTYSTGTEGPCVTCHMSGAEAHTFEVSAASTACANCHSGLTTEILEASKHEFHLALDELKNELAAEGIHFYPAHPYFYAAPYIEGYKEEGACSSNLALTNWNKGGTNIYKRVNKADGSFDKCVLDTSNPAYVQGDVTTWKDRMGAAFNFNMLDHEPGAFAHNRQYSLKLIQDSIDYLADGAVDGLGTSAVVAEVMENKDFARATSHVAAATASPSATSCASCHEPSPHYGGNAFLKAQYVSSASQPVSCANCHGEPADAAAYQTIVAQYADSAHADEAGEAWIHYDWRTANRSACARCHNGSAFVAKLEDVNSTTNVFVETDVLKPGETLACSACHTDAAAGELRSPSTSFTINMKNSATATYTVDGASALCARCHSGRETGESIKADVAADGPRVFIDSHYLPVSGTLYNNGGYEYTGQSYDSLGSHKNLGAGGQGPCVTCHMAGGNHSFVAAACNSCHDGTSGTVISNQKATYDAALAGLKSALEAKGIHYGPVHPFFFTAPYVPRGDNVPVTNWAIGGANWKDVMGAAFNYNMLWSDKGAYAHNYAYAMKLIEDSTAFMGTVVLP